MQVRFSSVDKDYIKSMVKNGFYTTENELVRDAVRRMREANGRNSALWEAIAIGEAQIRAGDYVEYTPELLEQLGKNALGQFKAGKKPNPDVLP